MTKAIRLAAKATATARCVQFSLWGADWRSKALLFRIGVLASIWPSRKPWLLTNLQTAIANQAVDGLLLLRMRLLKRSRECRVASILIRAGNRADYQSMWECLMDDVYRCPATPIKHVLDGGANLGFFTIHACKTVAARDYVLIEPEPRNRELLEKNVASLPGCKVLPYALSATRKTAEFLLADSNTGHLNGAPSHCDMDGKISVECVRIGDVLPPAWDMSKTWLKLDIEGAEYEVIPDLLSSGLRPKVLSIELHEYDTAGGSKMVKLMQEAGYTVSIHDPGSDLNVCRQVTAIHQ